MEDMRLSVFILGTTAVGKTKLSLELCKHLNGQIISCDSKQLYRYANLMTAKPSAEQLQSYKHNMVNCLDLQEASYNRNKFYQQVKNHTRRIWNQKKTPIFIGGTNYYIEPLLYNVENLGRIKSENEQNAQCLQKSPTNSNKMSSFKRQQFLASISSMSKQQKYTKLKQVDPIMAQRLHKNDETRITSFLQRFYKHNKKPSEEYKPFSNQLNNQNTLLFWVRNSDKLEHKVVVEQRIKQMLGKQGLLQILSLFMYLDIHNFTTQKSSAQSSAIIKEQQSMLMSKDNLTQKSSSQSSAIIKEQQSILMSKDNLKRRLTVQGIGQSIGYKEFFEFYYHFKASLLQGNKKDQLLKEVAELYIKRQIKYDQIHRTMDKNYQAIQKSFLNLKLLEQAQDQLIRDTWAYCKRQITWIRNRIFQKDSVLLKRFYILDLANKERKNSQSQGEDQSLEQVKKTFDKKELMQRFQTKVRQRAITIVDQIMQNGPESTYEKYQHHQDEFKQTKVEIKLEDWKKYKCDQCDLQINGPTDWHQHIKSKRHLKRMKYLQKKEDIDKWIQFRKNKQLAQKPQNFNKNQKQDG